LTEKGEHGELSRAGGGAGRLGERRDRSAVMWGS
jgi:hypothetical protein